MCVAIFNTTYIKHARHLTGETILFALYISFLCSRYISKPSNAILITVYKNCQQLTHNEGSSTKHATDKVAQN